MEKYKELLEEDEEFAEDMDAYLAEGVFWVPEIARWDYIARHSKQAEIGQIVDSALDAIEKENDAKNKIKKNKIAIIVITVILSKMIIIVITHNNDYEIFDKIINLNEYREGTYEKNK